MLSPSTETHSLAILPNEMTVPVETEPSNSNKLTLMFQKMRTYHTTWVTALSMILFAVVTSPSSKTPPFTAIISPRVRRNILSGAIIFTIGDVGAQLLTMERQRKYGNGEKNRFDQQRLAISTALGAVWAGIANPAVYGAVERVLPGSMTWHRVLLKMALSCSVLSTAGNWITMFMRRAAVAICDTFAMQMKRSRKTQASTSSSSSVASSSVASSVASSSSSPSIQTPATTPIRHLSVRLRQAAVSCNRDFGEVLRDDLKIWPAYDVLCYSVIPPVARPITTALMASAWSMYMSIVSAKEEVEVNNEEGDKEEGEPSIVTTN